MLIRRNPIQCVDIIAELDDLLVLIERLNDPFGVGLSGGKIESGETILEAAVRELKEETNLTFVYKGTLGIYDAPGRDPRGDYVSTVVYGKAYGIPRPEANKTRVILQPPSEALRFGEAFVCDHRQMISDYLERVRG